MEPRNDFLCKKEISRFFFIRQLESWQRRWDLEKRREEGGQEEFIDVA